MADQALFLALANALGRPSKALRATEAAGEAGRDVLGGYLQGNQIRHQLAQPAATSRLFSSLTGNQDVDPNAFYGMPPQDVLNYSGKLNQLKQQRELGMAGISERNTASQRAADTANTRTTAMTNLGGAKNITANIADHENQIKALSTDQTRLATQVPGGVGGMIQNLLGRGGDITQYLQDPKYGQIAAQMKQNQAMINFHQKVLEPMYRSQGIIPQNVLDNNDISQINPPPSAGDNSIPGDSGSGVSIF